MRPILFGLLFGGTLGFVIGNSFGAWRVRQKMQKAIREVPAIVRKRSVRVVGRDATPPPPTRAPEAPTLDTWQGFPTESTSPRFRPGRARP